MVRAGDRQTRRCFHAIVNCLAFEIMTKGLEANLSCAAFHELGISQGLLIGDVVAVLTLAGYFANWNMFDPRKLIPLSIEFCKAPMAVITEMTEKTPIVIPVMVKAERSLFAPNEVSAIFIISLKRIRNGVLE